MPDIAQSFNTAYRFSDYVLQPATLGPAWALPPPEAFGDEQAALTPAYNIMAEAGWQPAVILSPQFDAPEWATIFSGVGRLPVDIGRLTLLLASLPVRHKSERFPDTDTTWELGVMAAGTRPPLQPNKIAAADSNTIDKLVRLLRTLPMEQDAQPVERLYPPLPAFWSLCIMDYWTGVEHQGPTLLRERPRFGLWVVATLRHRLKLLTDAGFDADVFGASIKMSATPKSRAGIRPTVMASDLAD